MSKIKKYWEENHEKCYAFGAGVGLAVITCAVMRERFIADVPRVSAADVPRVSVNNRSLSLFSHVNNPVIVKQRIGRGHPGYLVRCVKTGEIFRSQNALARILDVPASVVSGHLNGKLENINGEIFERVVPTQ